MVFKFSTKFHYVVKSRACFILLCFTT